MKSRRPEGFMIAAIGGGSTQVFLQPDPAREQTFGTVQGE
jgi:hypothetical protein